MAKYQNKLIISGGVHSHSTQKLLLNDLIVVNNWTKACTSFHFMEKDFKRRYLHASCVFGDHMVIHGGVNHFFPN